MSNTLINNTIPTILVVCAFIGGIVFLFKTRKREMMRAFYALPYVSQLAREIDLTRFTRSLFLLLNAGIPITNALELTEEVVIKKEVSIAIKHAKDSVISGKKLSEGFKDYRKIFPNIVLKITEAGEKSGSLDKSMQDASDYLDYQVSNSIKLVTALIEPLLLVFVGGMVGGMMLAIIAPIYGLIGQVGGGH